MTRKHADKRDTINSAVPDSIGASTMDFSFIVAEVAKSASLMLDPPGPLTTLANTDKTVAESGGDTTRDNGSFTLDNNKLDSVCGGLVATERLASMDSSLAGVSMYVAGECTDALATTRLYSTKARYRHHCMSTNVLLVGKIHAKLDHIALLDFMWCARLAVAAEPVSVQVGAVAAANVAHPRMALCVGPHLGVVARQHAVGKVSIELIRRRVGLRAIIPMQGSYRDLPADEYGFRSQP
jgi:hypothetical protein